MSASTAAYPKSVLCDFRKLNQESLIKILACYQIHIDRSQEIPSHQDLVVMAARMFHTRKFAEQEVVDKFAAKYCLSTMDINNNNAHLHATISNFSGNKQSGSGNLKTGVNFERLQLDSEPAKVGEQVNPILIVCLYEY